MNQAQREPMEDAAKKRREYLRKKTAANTLAVIGGFVAICFTVPAGLLGIILFFSFVDGFFTVRSIDTLAVAVQVGALLLLALSGGVAFLGSRRYQQKARSLPYVAPVHEQVAALPPDEVLVRGSNQPATSPQELVRAAAFNEATSEADLLRAADSESSNTERHARGDTG